jgi:predicted ester cyclase
MIPVLRQAFPDLEYTIEDQISEGDKVAQRLTARGTLKGEFMGMQPTGKTAVWQEMHWHRFDAGGLLVEHWDITDSLGMMLQLGVGPASGEGRPVGRHRPARSSPADQGAMPPRG